MDDYASRTCRDAIMENVPSSYEIRSRCAVARYERRVQMIVAKLQELEDEYKQGKPEPYVDAEQLSLIEIDCLQAKGFECKPINRTTRISFRT